jgi:hypothetical protein
MTEKLFFAETETEVAKKSSWDQANRGEKHGLIWRNRKKISQIIKDFFYLPFFLLIILWYTLYSTNVSNASYTRLDPSAPDHFSAEGNSCLF